MELIVEAIENNNLGAEICIRYDESDGIIGCSIYW